MGLSPVEQMTDLQSNNFKTENTCLCFVKSVMNEPSEETSLPGKTVAYHHSLYMNLRRGFVKYPH